MKGFIKFASIMSCCVLCFIGGIACGDGENHVAAYCVVGGVWLLLNGYVVVLEIETNEIVEKSHRSTEEILKETKKMGRKLT